MDNGFDLVVIGGGAAGSAAALSAARRGARVALVRAGPGVTAMTTGAWNGPLPDDLARALAEAGLPLARCDHPLPHADGELRRCTVAAATHSAAHIDERTLVCGIAGLAGFHAPALARLWGETMRETPRHATLHIENTPRAGWSPVSLAATMERDPRLLARRITAALRGRDASSIILPAVLGFEDPVAVMASVRAATGLIIAEALASPPSVPGWRLAQALDRALRAAGVEIVHGRASRAGDARTTLETLRVSGASGDTTLTASRFVLATGKFAGGGIAGDETLRETTLDCPVWVEALGQRFDAPHALALTHAERNADQPMLQAGVRADEAGRPIGPDGDIVFDDVIVAGSVRTGVTTANLGLGDAAEDGWRAGELVEALT